MNASALATDDAIVQCFLQGFQRELRGFRRWVPRMVFRHAPMDGYVQQFSRIGKRGRLVGEVLRRWHITDSTIEVLPDSFRISEQTRRSVRFFTSAQFAFCLPDESGVGAITSVFGPLWGHGQQYAIVTADRTWKFDWKGGWKTRGVLGARRRLEKYFASIAPDDFANQTSEEMQGTSR